MSNRPDLSLERNGPRLGAGPSLSEANLPPETQQTAPTANRSSLRTSVEPAVKAATPDTSISHSSSLTGLGTISFQRQSQIELLRQHIARARQGRTKRRSMVAPEQPRTILDRVIDWLADTLRLLHEIAFGSQTQEVINSERRSAAPLPTNEQGVAIDQAIEEPRAEAPPEPELGARLHWDDDDSNSKKRRPELDEE